MKKFNYPGTIITLFLLFGGLNSQARETETMYLSGTDSNNTVDWQFFCTEGNNSGYWTTIPVPSNWEQHGFGTYNYGHAKDEERGKEKGLYKYEFSIPDNWKDKEVKIVFEGSMTDTEVKINGKSAGPKHQGAFYKFEYNISEILNYGSKNVLEVTVSKHSSNKSVNKAERYADYWIFGGIFRPVYLEVKPVKNIRRFAIDAKADGSFKANIFLNNAKKGDKVVGQITTIDNYPVGRPFTTEVKNNTEKVSLLTKLDDIKAWNPESPNLYKVNFTLYSKRKPVHETGSRFGFRTVEIRKRDGIYVNGVKIKFKGINHHTFRPETARASNKQNSITDVKLMKKMNMNAVRGSHYPKDSHFYEVCDSLGMFVLPELAGWHDAYDTEVGQKLVKEMVTHEVNHPSIIIWCNGNEGGHNFNLDTLYGHYDIQKRLVIHPWQEFNGTATQHYRSYDYGAGTFWHGNKIVFPTEFLHGMYDGGLGAGLKDYWDLMWDVPNSAGGFLWVFADEGIARSDKNGEIDTYGSAAADGILGPNHEKEGSFFAIKEIWSPVQIENKDIADHFDGTLKVENQYFYTNLNKCSFSWKLKKLPLPADNSAVKETEGKIIAPDVKPGHWGLLNIDLPNDWKTYDVLYITATDQYSKELYTWSKAISLPSDIVDEIISDQTKQKAVSYTESDSLYHVNASGIKFTINKNSGLLQKVENTKGVIPFNNGPDISAGITVFEDTEASYNADTLNIISRFKTDESRMKEFTWAFYPNGWAKLKIYYVPIEYDVDFDYMGVNFSYPEELVTGVKWYGRGPYRVWKNRMQGVELGVHQKDYNNTITGQPPLVYPEFKGYHANLYWAKVQSKEQSFTVATSSEDVYLRLYTPAVAKNDDPRVIPPFPDGDISFMQAIPPIGTKSNDPWNMGPSGKKNMYFDYGPYDDWRIRSKVMTLYFNFAENQ
jgi:hypothetical protein